MNIIQCAASVASRSFYYTLLPRATTRCARQSQSLPAIIRRRLAISPPDHNAKKDLSHLQRLEDANPERIQGILVNPKSVGYHVLPGNLVYKKYKWSGNTRKIPLELEHGYFWMISDLRRTDKKPTLSNETLISEEEAQFFPVLTGLKSLSRQNADLPFFFLDRDDNKSE